MTPQQRLFHEMSEARALFRRSRKALEEQPALRALLAAYRHAIDEVQNHMRQKGVAAACSLCAKHEQGGCCFEGIETAYDRTLLLVNLLLGCSFPDRREVPGGCLFVGADGCRLSARYYFCVHYLCPSLETVLGPAAQAELLSAVARELAAGWELEQAIREYFRKESTRAESVVE